MTKNQRSSSSSKADLDLSLKRTSVRLWILEGCDNKEPLLLKQDRCLGCFNLEFDRVIDDLPFSDGQFARAYMAGLKDEIAASLPPFRQTSLLEAKYCAEEVAKKLVASLSTQEVQETPLLKQHGSIAEFNQDFDFVTSDLTLAEEELVCVYIAGLEHEIAAPGRLLWPRTLREAKHQAHCHEFLIETQGEDVFTILVRLGARRYKKSQQNENLMNIKFSYTNDAIKQKLKELQNIKDNLIYENSDRKKNLLNFCKDCVKLSCSNDISETEDTTFDESHSQARSGPSQPTSDESHSQGSD